MSLKPSRGLYLYLRTLNQAMDDHIITDDEAAILHVLAKSLGVSKKIHLMIWKRIIQVHKWEMYLRIKPL